MTTIHEKFTTTRAELGAALIERETEIELALVALIAREHCLFVGPPGTAKSLLSDSIVKWMHGARFQILLTKYTTPEEVCGPISLKGLKEDRYARITTARLPEAHVAFIDEIWKASSAILNTLLTILNERQFDNDGARLDCPLKLCVAASNEWAGENGQGKETSALFDRFIFRRHVQPIRTARGLDRLLWADTTPHLTTTISPEEIDEAAAAAAALPWTDTARDAVLTILQEAKTEGITPGDRRTRKAIGAARAAAWLAGHAQVEKEDLEILAHILWDDPAEQPAKIAQIVGKIANPSGMRINSLLIEAEEILSATDTRDLAKTSVACKKLAEIFGKLHDLPGGRAKSAAEHVGEEIKRIRLATVEAL